MKVLIVTTGYPRNPDDLSGVFIKRLAEAIAKQATEVAVLAPGDREVVKPREKDAALRVIRFPYAPGPLMRIAYGNGGIPENLRRQPWLFFLLPFFVCSLIIHTIILAGRHDVIHANWLATGLFCLPARYIRKKPLVVTLRGSDLRKGVSKLSEFVIKRSDAVTTVNRQWATDIQRTFHRRVHYTPNGVSLPKARIDPRKMFGIGPEEIIVLSVGVLQERKGTDILSLTARALVDCGLPIRFLVVGPGNPAAFGLHVLPNVICTGGMAPRDVLALYSPGDIFVLPSRFEGRPNVLLEAMAAGMACVATKLPGVLELLDDQSGMLVDMEDVQALMDAICHLAEDAVMRKVMGERARKRISALSLDWKSSAEKYLEIFEGPSPAVA